MKTPKIYNAPGFQYGYVRSQKEMYGTMGPSFQPHWWAQYLGNGQSAMFDIPEDLF